MMNKLIVCLLPGLMLQGQVWAASFDCAKASTKVEQMICDNWKISHMDEELAWALSEKLKKSVNSSDLMQSQHDWITVDRNACTSEYCLESAYDERLKMLGSNKMAFDKANALAVMQYLNAGENIEGEKGYLKNLLLGIWRAKPNECRSGSLKASAVLMSKDILEIVKGNFEVVEGKPHKRQLKL